MSADRGRGVAVAGHISAFLGGWRFPVVALSFLVSLHLAMLATLVWPGESALLEEFRIWCFGYDPATGTVQWMRVAMLFLEPLGMGALIAGVWRGPLTEALRTRPAAVPPWVAVGAALVLVVASGFTRFEASGHDGELPFPADALRVSLHPPELALIDQHGVPTALSDLRGRVVVLTAIYAHCTHTCPAIVAQGRAALAGLTDAERADVSVIAVTLDPERDTPESLAQLALGLGLDDGWRLLSGPPPEVERVLDAMDVSRKKDPETGVIEHVNLFLVIDREGRVAYRLSLGERQQQWLTAALRVLVGEGDLGKQGEVAWKER